ncbi:uncharacterized protein [Elaeis guineensis]|uniref:Uncharacterized protein LOC105047923 isoform X1 n=1 Tax=Elaeis guineensis var. tenera TaxID=51953 RepID=A0A6I9RFE8_ELAGV|nr:uncharacterized protein LOC105047923 isoform X1 [Elaeis guineensis]
MDNPWRFRPIQGHLCPVCSTFHFPFCPPPPAFDHNRYAGEHLRRFPPEIHPPLLHDPPFPRPVYDTPFRNPRAAPPMPLPEPAPRGPEPWVRNLALEREHTLRPAFHPSRLFVEEEFLERENTRKRMRVEDLATGNLPPPPHHYNRYDYAPGRISADDERRLNLIRDHGWQHSTEGPQQLKGEYRTDRFGPDGMQKQYQSVGADHGFHALGTGSVGSNGPLLPQEHVFSQQNHRLPNANEDYQNFLGAVNPRSSDRFVPPERVDFERGGAYNPQSGEYVGARNIHPDASFQPPRSHRHGDFGVDSDNHVAHVADERRAFYESRQPPDYASEGPPGKYYGNDHQQFHPIEKSFHGFPKHPQYSETARGRYADVMQTPSELKPPVPEDVYKPFGHETFTSVEQAGPLGGNQGSYPPLPGKSNRGSMTAEMLGPVHNSQMFPSLPPPPPPEVHTQATSSSSTMPSTLFPVPSSTPATTSFPPNTQAFSEHHPLPQSSCYNEAPVHISTEFATEGLPFIHQAPPKQYLEGGQAFSLNNSLKDKPTVIDARQLFKQPHCASRPDHIVVILRGLPGSGKSYLAKALRDLEVENGGNAPRIHAMDDYFMIEVEKKIEDHEVSKSSSSHRGKKQITKKVIEYCYEPEMEETYRSSMLKAFKKTLDEGIFTFVIVDDRNLRVADFAQFWAVAKRSGYEVYLLEAPYKDPMGCAARNVHGFHVDDIQKMAAQWEEAPSLYLQLDIQSLFHGDDLNEHSIQEVDMDMDDSDCADEAPKLLDKEDLKLTDPKSLGNAPDDGLSKVGERWDSEEEEEPLGVKELERSKWSRDLDEDIENSEGAGKNSNALSGLIQAYSKSEKSVHWGDQADRTGFSIAAAKKRASSSLIIGPGSGYNLESNPLVDKEDAVENTGRGNINESRKRFHEQLRAERESFKAVFDRRRQRIGGLYDVEDE